jgi:EpsI family protein
LHGTETILEQVLVSSSGRQRLVWYWYQVAGWRTANEYAAKLLQLAGLVTGDPQAAVVAVATDMDRDVVAARQALSEFVQVMKLPLAQAGNGHSGGG